MLVVVPRSFDPRQVRKVCESEGCGRQAYYSYPGAR